MQYCPSGRFTNPNAGVSETLPDNACEVCSPGQFPANPDSSACKFCAPGFAFTGTDTACEGCPPGTYQNGQCSIRHLCRVQRGHDSDTSNSVSCIDCPAGRNLVVIATGSEYHDDAEDCLLCPPQTYNFQPGLSMDCFRCETSNSTGATSCDGCNPGMFKDSTNQCLDCEAGRFQRKRLPGCMDCPRGFYGVEITLTKRASNVLDVLVGLWRYESDAECIHVQGLYRPLL